MDSKLAYMGGIVRIVTTLVGGWLTQKGWSTEADVESIAGAIVLVATGIWSIWAKRKVLKAVPPAAKAALALIACSIFLSSGCAVIHGGAGESRYTGFAMGEKASSTLAGLNLTETTTQKGKIVTERGVGVDQSGSAGEADVGKILGKLLLLGLQSQGVPVKVADVAEDDTSLDPSIDSSTVLKSIDGSPTTPAPRSVITGEGVSVVAVLGNRSTCPLCRKLWGSLNPEALSEALCGTSVIDADMTDNAAAFSKYRPSGGFQFPFVSVYGSDGKNAGTFVARGMTQAQIADKVKTLLPTTCAALSSATQ